MNQLSIIIPVYNVAPYLRAAIDSCLKIPDTEVVCVDDGSSDESGSILNDYSVGYGLHRIKVFHQKNSGVSVARNKGIENATGEWITFLDGDDVLNPDGIASILKHADPRLYDVVVFNYCGTGRQIGGVRYGELSSDWRAICAAKGISACGAMYRRAFIAEAKLCFPAGIAINEDFAFVAGAFAKTQKAVFVNYFGLEITPRANSVSRSGRSKYVYINCAEVAKIVLNEIKQCEVSDAVKVWAAKHINCETFQHWDILNAIHSEDQDEYCVLLRSMLLEYLATFKDELVLSMRIVLRIVACNPRLLFVKPYFLLFVIKLLRRFGFVTKIRAR